MSCESIQARLQDLLDGELAGEERATVESHLATCLPCRRELAALEAVIDRAHALPRELTPERDLWPAVEARIGGAVHSASFASGRLPRWGWLAVAALVAAMIGLPLALRQSTDAGGHDAGREAAAAIAPPAPIEASQLLAKAGLARHEDGTQHSRIDLEVTIERQRGVLPPEVVDTLKENMRILDDAVGELRAALDDDPLNRRLNLLLAARYQQESELAMRVNRI
jgi:anti-sigma factor RsiW